MPKKIAIPYPPNPTIGEAFEYQYNGGKPFLFTISEPNNIFSPLYDVCLALRINPDSIDEKMTKNKTLISTYGGFIEYIWPDELDSISASSSTGAFISPKHGLTTGSTGEPSGAYGGLSGRRGTLSYERFEDFRELFHNNGVVYDSKGIPAIRGRVMMIYDRGLFIGHFTTFDVNDEDEKQFSMTLSWEFKVEQVVYRFNPFLF